MKLKKRKKSTKDFVKEIVSKVENKKKDDAINTYPLIHTGSALLNLACSDNINGGYSPGKISNLIGDSSSGKTIVALTMLAELAKNKEFDDYRLIFDDAEQALEFNIEYLFGTKTAKRIETDIISNSIEDWYGNILRVLHKSTPFVYVLDSFDSITSIAEMKRSVEYEDKKDNIGGSYKTEKPKLASEILRVIKGEIKQTKSFVLIISQTRDNIGFGAQFKPKVRSGGTALKFYCCHEIWLAIGKKIEKRGIEIGNNIFAKVTKNKLTGKKREVKFPVFYDYGTDDVTACIDFLIESNVWKKVSANKENNTPAGINSNGFIDICSQAKLVRMIEENNLEDKLFSLAEKQWLTIEETLKLNRKKKYA